MNNNIDIILNELDRLYPNAICELEYTKDYELLIAVVLSSQTTDKRVNMVTRVLFKKYPNLEMLKDAPLEDLMNILKPIGTFRRKAVYIKNIASKLYNDYNSIIPNDRAYLESLDGVGHKTANVVLSILFNESCIAVDTHVIRVSKRLGLSKTNDNVHQIEQKLMALIKKERWSKSHLQLVLFGRYECKAIKPNCINCNLKNICKNKKES
jgi:endonuclease-3